MPHLLLYLDFILMGFSKQNAIFSQFIHICHQLTSKYVEGSDEVIRKEDVVLILNDVSHQFTRKCRDCVLSSKLNYEKHNNIFPIYLYIFIPACKLISFYLNCSVYVVYRNLHLLTNGTCEIHYII